MKQYRKKPVTIEAVQFDGLNPTEIKDFVGKNCEVEIYDNEEFWRTDEEGAKEDAQEAEFLVLGDKCYCPECYHYDDDDNIVTKDGKKFNGDTREEM